MDFDDPEGNDWLAVNQFTVTENRHVRRPDVVLFINGLSEVCRWTPGGIIGGVIRPVGKEKMNVSAEENKALVRREQEELWNHAGNLDAAEELFVPDYVEAVKQEAAEFRRGFPDVVSTVEDLVAEGDKVVARWRSRATHQGEYMGVPPTGNAVEFTGISVYRIERGRIAESWNVEDKLGLLRQIGTIAEPEQ